MTPAAGAAPATARAASPAAFETVDVLVAGGGRAGLTDAAAAASGGAAVLCVEREDGAGGKLRRAAATGDIDAGRMRDALRSAATAAGVRLLTRAGVFGVFANGDGSLTAAIYDHAAGEVRAVRAGRVIVATGNPALWLASGGSSTNGLRVTGSAARSARTSVGIVDDWAAGTADHAESIDRPTIPVFPVPIEALAAFADRAQFGAGRPTLTLDVG